MWANRSRLLFKMRDFEQKSEWVKDQIPNPVMNCLRKMLAFEGGVDWQSYFLKTICCLITDMKLKVCIKSHNLITNVNYNALNSTLNFIKGCNYEMYISICSPTGDVGTAYRVKTPCSLLRKGTNKWGKPSC